MQIRKIMQNLMYQDLEQKRLHHNSTYFCDFLYQLIINIALIRDKYSFRCKKEMNEFVCRPKKCSSKARIINLLKENNINVLLYNGTIILFRLVSNQQTMKLQYIFLFLLNMAGIEKVCTIRVDASH